MTTRTILLTAISFGVLLLPVALAQSKTELERKYPKVDAYVVRPRILLTAKYTDDGRVCEMVLQPRRWTGDTIQLFQLSEEETIRVVEEIVPEGERGKKSSGPDGLSLYAGHSYTTTFEYQNIILTFSGTTENGGADMVALVTWRNRKCR